MYTLRYLSTLFALTACLAQALAGPQYDGQNGDGRQRDGGGPGDNNGNGRGDSSATDRGKNKDVDTAMASATAGGAGAPPQTIVITVTSVTTQMQVQMETMMMTVTVTAVQPCSASSIVTAYPVQSGPPASSLSTTVLTLPHNEGSASPVGRFFTTTDPNFKQGLTSIPVNVASSLGVAAISATVSPGGFYTPSAAGAGASSTSVFFAGTTFLTSADVALGKSSIPVAQLQPQKTPGA